MSTQCRQTLTSTPSCSLGPESSDVEGHPTPQGLCLPHLELRPNGSGVSTEGSISRTFPSLKQGDLGEKARNKSEGQKLGGQLSRTEPEQEAGKGPDTTRRTRAQAPDKPAGSETSAGSRRAERTPPGVPGGCPGVAGMPAADAPRGKGGRQPDQKLLDGLQQFCGLWPPCW